MAPIVSKNILFLVVAAKNCIAITQYIKITKNTLLL